MTTQTSVPVPGVFDRDIDHEQVVYCQDRPTGLRAIIAIASTTLGPGLGGTRFHPFATEQDALSDVLALSTAMAYKAALAGLDLGGAKAVIIGDPDRDKSEALLRAYGRFVQSLGGRYITACDVGTTSADMDLVARDCAYVTGRTTDHGGAGDSSILTAYGILRGMQASVERVWGTPSLRGRRVGVAGVGKVGYRLVGHLVEEGANVVVSDVAERALAWIRTDYPAVDVATDTATLVRSDLDVYAPCALGGALDDDTVHALSARVVCGGANNQLAHAETQKRLTDRGILYAPDYCVNAGGLIQVADEIGGFDFARAKARAGEIYDTTIRVFDLAERERLSPAAAADRIAERRIADVGRLRTIWLSR